VKRIYNNGLGALAFAQIAAMAHICHAQPNDSISFADLASATRGGLVKEEVLQQISDISMNIETALQDRLATATVKSHKFECLNDSLAAPTDSSVAEGTDYPAVDADTGTRKQNYTQYNVKAVNVTDRSMVIDIHGRSDEMGYRTARRIRELQRDVETAIVDGNNASVQDNGTGTKGRTAPLAVQIESHRVLNGATGGGFDTGTGLFTAITVGTGGPVALKFSDVRTMIEGVYLDGGNISLLTSHPSITKRVSEYLVGTPAAFVPIVGQSDATKTTENLKANGYVDFFKTDFGTVVQILPNRSQKGYSAPTGTVAGTAAHVFLLDTGTEDVVYIEGIKVEPLAKTGLYTRKGIKADWGLRVKEEKANAVIMNTALTGTVTAT
jgi:hypothetical protein